MFDEIIIITDTNWKVICVNSEFERKLGFSIEEFYQKDLSVVFPEESRIAYQDDLLSLANSDLEKQEFCFRTKQKKNITVEVKVSPGKWSDLDVFFIGLRDISRYSDLEKSLVRRDEIVKFVAGIADLIFNSEDIDREIKYVIKRLGELTEVSHAFIFKSDENDKRLFGKSKAQGRSVSLFFDWSNPELIKEAGKEDIKEMINTDFGFERWMKILNRGGIVAGNAEEFPISERQFLKSIDVKSVVIVPVFLGNSWWGFIGFAQSKYERAWSNGEIEALKTAAAILGTVIQRRQFEDAIESSQNLYYKTIDALEYKIFIIDAQMKFVLVNAAMQRWMISFGVDPNKIAGSDIQKAPFWDESFRRDYKRVFKERENILSEETIEINGVKYIFDIQKIPIIESERVIRIVTVIRDITGRKTAEKALKESEQRFRDMADNIREVFWLQDRETVLYISPAFDEIWGMNSTEALKEGNPFLPQFPEEREIFQGSQLDKKEFKLTKSKYEFRIIRPDGDIRWIRARTFPILKGGKKSMISGIAEDVTDQKNSEIKQKTLEERANRNQRLESLGVLAGGVAHDFNNLLQIVRGYLELSLFSSGENEILQDNLKKAINATDRASDLTKQMLAYSGQGKYVVKPLNLSEKVQEMIDLVQATLSKKIELKTDLPLEAPTIMADQTQVQQIVMNLVTNAAEAIGKESGRIEICTGIIEINQEFLDSAIAADEASPGKHVFVEVNDNGCGMDEETKSRIFEPFFSTKFAGRGLGLSAVLGIVRSHQGAVQIESELGVGTRIRIMFPVKEEQELELEDTDLTIVQPLEKQTGNILIVDDEDEVLNVMSRILTNAGYTVFQAKNGEQALELFKKYQEKIDVVLLDYVMPVIDGREVLIEMKKHDESIPVLILSGLTREKMEKEFEDLKYDGLIQKPFQTEKLLDMIRMAKIKP